MLLIKNGVVRQKKMGKALYEKADILVEEDRIKDIASLILEPAATVIDAEGKLVIPGLINCHLHSHDNFNRAWIENLPLEVWMPVVRPFYTGVRHTPEQVYYRTLLGAAEMIHTGTTAVMDDVLLNGILDSESLDMIVKAYEDIGMRAVVLPHTKNIPMERTIPYAQELFTEKMKAAGNTAYPSEECILAFMEEKIRQYNKPNRRVTVGLSTSAPQRSTPGLMRGFQELSERYHVPVASHVLETYMQQRTGDLFYGKSLVKYLSDLKLLDENFVLIHCNWVDEEDIQIIKAHGCKVVHNPVCNMKMGSGIAPVSELFPDVPVGLGSDNISANDSANLFEAMKFGCLLSKIRTPDYSRWLTAENMVDMATGCGSQCLNMEKDIGSLQVGKKADLVFLDTANPCYLTASDYDMALAYSENGSSVSMVMVDGKIILRDKKLTCLDEEQLYDKILGFKEAVAEEHNLALKESRRVGEIFSECYKRCNAPRF